MKWVAVVGAMLAVLSQVARFEFPEWFTSRETEMLMEHEMAEFIESYPEKISKKYREDSAAWHSQLDQAIRMINTLRHNAGL